MKLNYKIIYKNNPKVNDSKPATGIGREKLGKSKGCGCPVVAQW
jgi:hypothetical protein